MAHNNAVEILIIFAPLTILVVSLGAENEMTAFFAVYTFLQEQFIFLCIPCCSFDESFNFFGRVFLSDYNGF